MPRKPAMTPQERAARQKERRIAKELREPPRESEAAIQSRIIGALEAVGCLVERRGEAQGRGGKGGGAFKTGEPDLRVSFRGRTFGIEVKRDAKEKLRDDQIAWYRANAANVPYFVCCAHEQAAEVARLFIYANLSGGRVDVAGQARDCRVVGGGKWTVLQ